MGVIFPQVICFHALGDKEKMKKSFLRLLSIQPPADIEEDDPADGVPDEASDA